VAEEADPNSTAADAGRALARYYDLDLAEDQGDVDLYLAFADEAAAPVLELMAGTGRVAVPLALAGHAVTAVDIDPLMLERASARWDAAVEEDRGSLDLIQRNVGHLDLGKRFGLVLVALNSLLLLDDRAAQRELLATVARHLAEEGRAVIDVWLPTPDDLELYDGRVILDWVREDPDTGEKVAKLTSATYETGTRTAHVTSFFDAWHDGRVPRRTVRQDEITFVSCDELVTFAEAAGLRVETLGSDYDMGPFAAASDRVVMVCRAGSR
jgi:SAM-dependent methyltransferase